MHICYCIFGLIHLVESSENTYIKGDISGQKMQSMAMLACVIVDCDLYISLRPGTSDMRWPANVPA